MAGVCEHLFDGDLCKKCGAYRCPDCNGDGEVECGCFHGMRSVDWSGSGLSENVVCDTCGGSGRKHCPNCGGSGGVPVAQDKGSPAC